MKTNIEPTRPDDWWRPEQLEKLEKNTRLFEGLSLNEPLSDFGTYKRISNGSDISTSMLASINELLPKNKIKFLNFFLKVDRSKILSILDVGCGMGFTAECLGNFYKNAKVLGVDVSPDAIDFAKKNHLNSKFLLETVKPDNDKIGDFDLIFCFEFYPFTRTADLKIHQSFLKYFLKQLNPSGRIVLYQKWFELESIYNNFKVLKDEFPNFRFELVHVPHNKLLKYIKSHLCCSFLDHILCKCLNKKVNKAIIISKD